VAAKLSLTVSQLNEYIRRSFQMDPMLHGIELRGEISNLKFHQTGTLFFTLKDESAAISCVMYAQDTYNLQSMPFDGMRAVVSGNVSLYVRGGQMQLYVSSLRAEGVGVLYERLQILKARLASQGLFDSDRKKPLPEFPDTVGVVSSPTGAVIHDIIHVSSRRDPQVRILLCPVRVQGVGAAQEIVDAIRMLERLEHVSVIIIARGGGSMEDLWTFNEEEVVRAVAGCSKPVVSAVGHETDVTLCDLAADLRAPTPSAAAECVVPRRDEIVNRLSDLQGILNQRIKHILAEKEAGIAHYTALIEHANPKRLHGLAEERLRRAAVHMNDEVRRSLRRHEELLCQRIRELDLLSPYHVLSRGYAIVSKAGMPVKSALDLHGGERVMIRWADGEAAAQIVDQKNQEER